MEGNFDNIFITTTLPYINGSPHVGAAFEFILGDSINRFLKLHNHQTHFNVGLDEHGLKVWLKSKELNISTEEHIENLTKVWLDFCNIFNIKYDSFYKTSNVSHHNSVKIVWNRFLERGDIYKKYYSGKYCVGCESFKTDKELIDNKCPDHSTITVETIEEENYFFKLTKYKNILLNWIDSNQNFLEPISKIPELRNLILESEDISISRIREKCPWGITVPDNENHTIYVWLDALLNYIFAAGYLTDNFKWEHVIQLCGPDNLRFQAVIFQAFLESEGIKKTNKLLIHGTILDNNGKKISKSLGNVIDPIEQFNKYGLDAIRYYLLAGINTYSNSSWIESDIVNLFNSNICNEWGNLLSRTLHLIDIKCDGKINDPSIEFKSNIEKLKNNINNEWFNFQVKNALQLTNELVKIGNKHINDFKPWSTNNYDCLNDLYYLIQIINELYSPVFPDKYILIKENIEKKKKFIPFTKLNII